MPSSFSICRHAKARISERRIPMEIVILILIFADEVAPTSNGRSRYRLSRRTAKRLADFFKCLPRPDMLLGTAVITTDTGVVLTVYQEGK